MRCLILPTTLFLTNKKGYPVLSKAHQALVKRFAVLEVQFILTGASRYQSISYYHNYLDYLWKVKLKRYQIIIKNKYFHFITILSNVRNVIFFRDAKVMEQWKNSLEDTRTICNVHYNL